MRLIYLRFPASTKMVRYIKHKYQLDFHCFIIFILYLSKLTTKTMKKLILAVAVLAIFGCKKKDVYVPDNNPFSVKITGLTANTALTMHISDVTQGNTTVLDFANKYGDTTYVTHNVTFGDKLYCTYTTNIPAGQEANGDGMGYIFFYFKGEKIGATGGLLRGTATVVLPKK